MLASGKVWSKIPQLEFPQVPVILFLLGLEYLGTVKLEYIQLEFPQVPVILFPVIQGFADVLATVKLEYQDLETRYMYIGRMSQSIYISKLWMEVLSIIKERFTRFQQLIWRALKSPLMGIFEKHHVHKFFIYVQDYDENDPKTHEGMDLTRVTTREPIAYTPDYFLFFSSNISIDQYFPP